MSLTAKQKATRLRKQKVRNAIAMTVAVVAVAGSGGTYAALTASQTSDAQMIGSGASSISCDGGTFDNPIRNLAAGDSSSRTMTLLNDGTLDYESGSVTLLPVATGGTALTTSPTGVSLRVESAGQVVLPSTVIASWTDPISLDLPAASLAAGGSTPLSFVWTLDAAAPNALMGLSDSVTFTCAAVQSAGGTDGDEVGETIGFLPANSLVASPTESTERGTARLSFPVVENATGYEVRYAPVSTPAASKTVTTTKNSYDFVGLTPGLSYVVDVRALVGAAAGPWGGQTTLAAPAYTDPSAWTTFASNAAVTNLYEYGSVALDGKMYVIGGNAGGSGTNKVTTYTPATNTWAARAPLPEARTLTAAATYGGKIYAFGGASASGSFANSSVYDPTTNAWTAIAPMPTVRSGAIAQVVGDKILVAGGRSNTSAQLATVEMYDPATNTWSSGPSMPAGVVAPASEVLGDKVYVFGGFLAGGVPSRAGSVYDPATNAWTAMPLLATGRYSLASASVNGKLYAIGGWNNTTRALTSVEVYDPATNVWAPSRALGTGRYAGSAEQVDSKVYLIGGGLDSRTPSTTVQVFG